MPIYKPTELRQFLNELGIFPKKSLSQNFLIDGNIIRKIVAVSQATADDVILEIGPGPGALTEALLETKAKIVAVEKDHMLATALERLKREDNFLEVFQEDILQFPLEKAVKDKQKKIKVIANLPYHLTTPILSYLVNRHDIISQVVVMVQEEVARRFTAAVDTEAYSSYSLFLRYHTTPTYAFQVSRHCFYPPPKVDSAVVSLTLHTPPTVSSEESFFKMTRTAFEHRRKMLRASLRELYPPDRIEQALVEIGLNPQARPEQLGLEAFIALFEKVQSYS